MRKLYMIGNTHFDPVWLWSWDEGMSSIRATFRSALDRMKEDGKFIYSFSTPPVFEWIRNTDPDMFEEIKQRVKEGRWDLAEAWWVQPDCYSASGESYVRQGLYGQKYLKNTFGIFSDTVFNVDSFGHSPQLPQILKKSRVNNYCFTRPEKHHVSLPAQYFLWQGIDSSKIKTFRTDDMYSKDLRATLQQSDRENDLIIVYGVTDHGGAPTKKMIAEINNTPDAVFSSVSGFFAIDRGKLPVFEKELLTGDFGVYSNNPKIKALNRKAEFSALNAEAASVISGIYDSEKIENCWHDILFNQFHDILGGACIKDAYIDAENTFGRAIQTSSEIMHYNLQRMTAKIDTAGNSFDNPWNLVLWNLNGHDYDGYIEAEVQWLHEFDLYSKGLKLADSDGTVYECQIIKERCALDGFRSRFVFKAKVKSAGYKVLKLYQTGEEITKAGNSGKYEKYIETEKYRIDFSDKSGCIESIIEKKSGKKLSGRMLEPVCYIDMGDTWSFNITGYSDEKYNFIPENRTVTEDGSIRTVIKYDYVLKNSLLSVYYTFYHDEDYFDVSYSVNWNEKHMVFKLENEAGNIHTVSVPYGAIQRAESAADVPMGSWIKSGGITFIADSIFSYNMQNGVLGLTVLRSPIYGNLSMDEIDHSADHEFLSQGISEGKIRVAFNSDGYKDAQNFLNPPVVVCETNHTGKDIVPESAYGLDGDSVMLSAAKKCEYDDSLIFRAFEYAGNACEAVLRIGEETFHLVFTPFEIKTLKYEDGKLSEVYMTEA